MNKGTALIKLAFSWLVLVYALASLAHLIIALARVWNENILMLYQPGLVSVAWSAFLLMAYGLGAFFNIIKFKEGSAFLLFGCTGFIVSAFFDLIYYQSYTPIGYTVFILLNLCVLFLVDKEILSTRWLYYLLLCTCAVFILHVLFKIEPLVM